MRGWTRAVRLQRTEEPRHHERDIRGIRFEETSVETRANQSVVSQFLYINASFSPAPDDTVANLFKVRTCTLLVSQPDLTNQFLSASRQKDT
jgi:hypothetical protein